MKFKRVGFAAVCVSALLLTGCAGKVHIEPAQDAADPACANVMLALPDTLSGQHKRHTTSQSTAAWGDPSSVILKCGVKSPGATTTPCVQVDDIDWLSKDEGDHWRFTTYGRSPAVEVLIDRTSVSGTNVINKLGSAVASLPQHDHCVGPKDVTK